MDNNMDTCTMRYTEAERSALKTKIQTALEANRNAKRAAFQARLCPEIDPGRIYGLTMEQNRQIVRSLLPEEQALLLADLPHDSLEEDLMHVILLNAMKESDGLIVQLEAFLPYLTSWVQTDSISLKKLKDRRVIELACSLFESSCEYGWRLGIVLLIKRLYRLPPEEIRPYLDLALQKQAGKESRQLTMAKGWLLCEGVICHPQVVLPALEQDALPLSVRLSCVSKCMDSRRIDPPIKAHLRTLRQSWKAKRSFPTAILNEEEGL